MDARVDPLFPRPVLVAMVPAADEVNAPILAGLDAYPELDGGGRPDKWFCTVQSTFSQRAQVLLDPPFAGLLEHVQSAVWSFAEVAGWDMSSHEPRIVESWVNLYEGPAYQEVHQHPMSHISGVYFVSAPAGSGGLFFVPPEPTMFRAVTTGSSPFSSSAVTYPPEPGMLVLFPSELRHGVRPSEEGCRRVSVAFNVVQHPVGEPTGPDEEDG